MNSMGNNKIDDDDITVPFQCALPSALKIILSLIR